MSVEAIRDQDKKEIRYLVRGPLAADHAHIIVQLKDCLTENLDENLPWRYLLDCQFIKSIDSSGIGVLIFIKSKVTAVSGQFALINVPENIKKTLGMARMDTLFRIE